MPESKLPKEKILTVVIRDISLLHFVQEPPTFRSVNIELTEEQLEKLALRKTATAGPVDIYEEISTCFLEEPNAGK